jgi:hypothetical protein
LRNIQTITIYMICFMILSLCVTFCCVKRKNKKKINYGGVSASDQSMIDVGANVWLALCYNYNYITKLIFKYIIFFIHIK